MAYTYLEIKVYDNKLVHFSHKEGIMAEMYIWFLFLTN